jgi:hypothetical protein
MVPLAVAGVDRFWAEIECSLGAHPSAGLVHRNSIVISVRFDGIYFAQYPADD